MADVFISYAREDREAVEKLAKQVEDAGVSCWWDRQLAAGAKYRDRTEAELNAAKVVLVVWTKHSITSHWVADEAAAAVEADKLVPIALDGSTPPLGFRQFQTIDFAPWIKGKSTPFDELIASLAPPGPVAKIGSTAAETNNASRLPRLAVGAAILTFVLGLGVWAASSLFTRTRLDPSIAVLPFANDTGDPTKGYLAHGIAAELIETLSQIDKLKVVGRASSFTYKPDADPRTVGPALRVANVLSGTVSDDKDGIRISFELADAGSGRTILAKTYTAALTTANIAAAQRYVAEQVAGSLSIAFDIKGGTQLLGSGTRSMEAYDYYLQGRESMGQAGSAASENLFTKAVSADPEYGAAWGLLAITHGSTSWNRATPAEARAEQDAAYVMAKKAVTLDPDVSTSQAVFANLATTQHNWGEAEIASLRALDLSTNEIALGQRQFILLRSGRVTEAAALYPAIEEVAPHASAGVKRYNVLSALGRVDELRALVDSPDWKHSADVATQVSRLEGLIDLRAPAADVREALDMLARQPDRTLSEFAKDVIAVFSDRAKARLVLRKRYEGPGFESALKYELIPFLAAWFGDDQLVLRVWRDDLPVNVVRMTQVWGPAYAGARSDPAFKTLMRDMGLVEYWRTYKWADKCRPVGAADFECG